MQPTPLAQHTPRTNAKPTEARPRDRLLRLGARHLRSSRARARRGRLRVPRSLRARAAGRADGALRRLLPRRGSGGARPLLAVPRLPRRGDEARGRLGGAARRRRRTSPLRGPALPRRARGPGARRRRARPRRCSGPSRRSSRRSGSSRRAPARAGRARPARRRAWRSGRSARSARRPSRARHRHRRRGDRRRGGDVLGSTRSTTPRARWPRPAARKWTDELRARAAEVRAALARWPQAAPRAASDVVGRCTSRAPAGRAPTTAPWPPTRSTRSRRGSPRAARITTTRRGSWASLKAPGDDRPPRTWCSSAARTRRSPSSSSAPSDERRRRDGFALTDRRMGVRAIESEVDYCLYCHDRDKDSCSKGLRDNKTRRASSRTRSASPLDGCPLDEKISEMHLMRQEGDSIAALALVCVDNPHAARAPATASATTA